MNLDILEKIASAASDVVTMLALVIGGGWAFFRYVLKRENAWNLVIEANPTFHPYRSGQILLSVEIVLKNIGQVRIKPSGVGCRLSIRLLPQDQSVGQTPHWKDSTSLLTDYDVLRSANPRLDNLPINENYWIEPNAHYTETVNVIVPKAATIMVEVVFGSGSGEEIWLYKVWTTPSFCITENGAIRGALAHPVELGRLT